MARLAASSVENIFDSYQAALKYEFEQRQKRNPMYSLRAYARDLDLSPSHLSKVLSNKSGLSTHRAMVVAKNMGLHSKNINWFKSLVEAQHSRNFHVKDRAQKTILKYESDGPGSPGLKLNLPMSVIQNVLDTHLENTQQLGKEYINKCYQIVKRSVSAHSGGEAELFFIDSKLLPELEELLHDFEARLRYLTNKSPEGDKPVAVLVGAMPLLRDDRK